MIAKDRSSLQTFIILQMFKSFQHSRKSFINFKLIGIIQIQQRYQRKEKKKQHDEYCLNFLRNPAFPQLYNTPPPLISLVYLSFIRQTSFRNRKFMIYNIYISSSMRHIYMNLILNNSFWFTIKIDSSIVVYNLSSKSSNSSIITNSTLITSIRGRISW